jgi:hypothetical protein
LKIIKFNHPLFISALLPCILSIGCGKSTLENDSLGGNFSISIHVMDDSGCSLQGFDVSTKPETKNSVTDSTGHAILENIPQGIYSVSIHKSNYSDFSKTITVNDKQNNDLSFEYLRKVSVFIQDDLNHPCQDAIICTSPPTSELFADDNGGATFTNMPFIPLDFIIKRERYPSETLHISVLADTLYLDVKSASPSLTIFSPSHGSFIYYDNAHFSGTGFDLEDGELPDSSLVWYSDLDGFLGYGKNITVLHLSSGKHVIKLCGTDSSNKKSENSISVNVINNSYFPIPRKESWTYRYPVSDLHITDSDNNIEHWSLMEMKASMGDNSERITEISWKVMKDNVENYCYLFITDYIETEGDNLYLTKSVEKYSEYNGMMESVLTIDATINYTPRYLFLKNFSNISLEKNYSSSVQVESIWNYVYHAEFTKTSHEINNLLTQFEVGGIENIETDKGFFPAVSLKITQNNTLKKWFLTKNIGLIRIEDYIFNAHTVAVLHNTSFYLPPVQKNISIQTGLSNRPMNIDFKLDRKNFENMKNFHKFLVNMCPR